MTSLPKPIEGRSQAEEMQLAFEEKRQPLCVYCGHPLNKVVECQTEDIRWKWDAGKKVTVHEDGKEREVVGAYEKTEDGDSDCPEHVCDQCDDECRVNDSDFVGNFFMDY